MIQRGSSAGLLLEAAQAFRVARKGLRQYFDGHVAPQPPIPSPIHLSHASGTEGGKTSYGPSLVPAARAMRARNYSPSSTVIEEALFPDSDG
jgi:hypothetical protein